MENPTTFSPGDLGSLPQPFLHTLTLSVFSLSLSTGTNMGEVSACRVLSSPREKTVAPNQGSVPCSDESQLGVLLPKSHMAPLLRQEEAEGWQGMLCYPQAIQQCPLISLLWTESREITWKPRRDRELQKSRRAFQPASTNQGFPLPQPDSVAPRQLLLHHQ